MTGISIDNEVERQVLIAALELARDIWRREPNSKNRERGEAVLTRLINKANGRED